MRLLNLLAGISGFVILALCLAACICLTGCKPEPRMAYVPPKLHKTDGLDPDYAWRSGPHDGDTTKPLYRVYRHSRHMDVAAKEYTTRNVERRGGEWYVWNTCDWYPCPRRNENLGWWYTIEHIDPDGTTVKQVVPKSS